MGWIGVGLAMTVAAALLETAAGADDGPQPSSARTPLESQVLDALNQARTDPAAFAGTLRFYRRFFHDRGVHLPGDRVIRVTTEGTVPLDEAIALMSTQRPLAAIASALVLDQAATDHVADQGASGALGHVGADGSMPWDRVRARGGGRMVSEVIAYGPSDATDVVRQLVIDDGVPTRGHRKILFDPAMRYAGVACGRHPGFRTMCVIDLAATPDAGR